MRRGLSILFLFVTISFSMHAQEKAYIDSLIIAERNSPNDSLRYDALRKLAIAYSDSEYNTSLDYWNRALELAKRKRDRQRMADVYHQLGYMLQRKGEFPEALEELKNAIILYEYVGDIKSKAEVFNDKGLIYKSWGKYELALECYLTALSSFEEIDFAEGAAMASNNIGQIHYYRQDYTKAIDYFTKYLEVNQQSKTFRAVAGASNNIASAYLEMEKFDLALDYFLKAMKLYDSLGVKLGVGILNDNIGTLYSKKGQHSDALLYHFNALRIFNELNSKPRKGYVMMNIGRAYYKLNDYRQALNYLNQSKDIAIELNQRETLKEIYFNLSNVYQGLNQYQQALNYHKQFAQLKDSLLSAETNEKLTTLEVRYEADKKSRELLLMKSKLDQQKRMALVMIGIGLLMLFLIGLVIKENYQKKKGLEAFQTQNIHLKEAMKSIIRESNSGEGRPEKFFSQQATIPESEIIGSPISFITATRQQRGVLLILKLAKHPELLELFQLQCHGWLPDILDLKTAPSPTEIIEEIISKIEQASGNADFLPSDVSLSCLIADNFTKKIYYQGSSEAWIIKGKQGEFSQIYSQQPINSCIEVDFCEGDTIILLAKALESDKVYDSNIDFSNQIEKTIEKSIKATFAQQKEILQSAAEFLISTNMIEGRFKLFIFRV